MRKASINVRIKGQAPGLLMSRGVLEPSKAFEKMSREEQIDSATYRSPEQKDGKHALCIPGSALQRALSKGCRAPIASCILVDPEWIILTPQTYTIHSSLCVIHPTRECVTLPRCRPWFPEWEAGCTITYDDTMLTEEQLRRVVDNAGHNVGLMTFRPEKGGLFGRFVVVGWEPSTA